MTEERWKIERSYRPAQRGPADRVADGWLMRDQLLGTRRWFPLKAECPAWAERVEADEAKIRELAEHAEAWWTTGGTHAGAEVWIVFGEGAPHARLCAGMVPSGPGFAEGLRKLLELVGLPSLPEEWS